jgi:methyl-accepting chemotaxis protein
MNFDEAIEAHANWKMKLRNYIDTKAGNLVAADVEKDNKCALGQWIYGEGARYSTLSEYTELKTCHAQFHKCAADVVRSADAGDKDKAHKLIESGSQYVGISSKVITLIRNMRTKAQAG